MPFCTCRQPNPVSASSVEVGARGKHASEVKLILHLQAALGPRTSVFLSDVETSTWSTETVPRLASKSARWLVTRGEFGADEVTAEGMQHLEAEKVRLCRGCAGAGSLAQVHGSRRAAASCLGSVSIAWVRERIACPAVLPCGAADTSFASGVGRCHHSVPAGFDESPAPCPQVTAVDTNGAGDTFATSYMLALAARRRSPGSDASWAASKAVMLPQACKPHCVTDRIKEELLLARWVPECPDRS